MDRSYAWNYAHAPALPRVRRLHPGPGARVLGFRVDSPLGVAAGPLLNARWIEGYARLGFDVLTYPTVRSHARAALSLPNLRRVENLDRPVVSSRRASNGGEPTLALSLGLPSMEPEVWRKDVRRARERIGAGQILVVSVVGTPEPGGDARGLVADYARCAAWAAEAGADAIEVHLAVPHPYGEPGELVYENLLLSAQILHRVRTTVAQPVLAKLGLFRTPRALHETATTLAPWASGYVLVNGIPRRVVEDTDAPAFEGPGREVAEIVGAATFETCARQVAEMLAWRRAGAWEHPVFAVGGITTVERARHLLHEGADAVMVATAALFDPLLAVRFRAAVASSAA